MLADIAGWVAPIATAIAATMTAANLGARMTGWGFVVFVIGSLAWCAVGAASGQSNLLLANGFLAIVNVVGVWRWLGRQARYEKKGKAAVDDSGGAKPQLLPATNLAGTDVALDGKTIGKGVEGMLDCATGRLDYLVVSVGGVGGVGERLIAVKVEQLALGDKAIAIKMSRRTFEALPAWQPPDAE